MKKKKMTMHVISGTHWDREWRHTAEQSKLRLCDLMDNIINILETREDYKCFCVDGGMIVIEDYLSVRPENKERIKKLISQKKMLVVNWYTLPETNTVAPESLVRNLLMGHKMAKEMGGGMKSGYTATAYGQNSQMPQLYNGFGIDTAIFYRGTNKYEMTPLFIWEGADGSTLHTLRTFDEVTRTNWFFYVHNTVVLGKPPKDLSYTYDKAEKPVHMADMGLYEKAFVLLKEDFDFNHDKDVLKKGLDAIVRQSEPYSIAGNLLALNMEDNDEPYRYLPQLINEMNAVSEGVEIIQDSLDNYMDTIRSQVEESDLARHKGELRYTTVEYDNFNALLGATHSSRIKIKLYNDKVETNLIGIAEPLASFASVFGKEYPRANFERAWQALLKNHAHDSICGAAVDLAHEDMMYNFSLANTVAEEVTARSAIALYRNINTAKDFRDTDHIITLFNTLPFKRAGIIPLVIDLPKSGGGKKADIGVDGAASCDVFYDIVDKDGNKLEYTELSSEDIKIGVERELDTKAIKFQANRRRILLKAEIPAMGYVSVALRFREPDFKYHPQLMEDRKLIARDSGILENEFVKVTLNPNGTFNLLDKTTGHAVDNMHYFADNGETGSAHISTKPKRDFAVTSIGCEAVITMTEANLLRGAFKVELSMTIPAAATLDGKDRLRETKNLKITYFITLEKDSKFVKIRTRLNNECRDHKLTVNFPTGIRTDDVMVDSIWDVVKRNINWRDVGDNFDPYVPFQPMQNFIDLSDGKHGIAFLNKGLREYEVCDDVERTVKLTLLRTHRAYMTANPDMIPEEYDKYTGLQSFGSFEYNYAVYPHTGSWSEGDVMSAANDYKVDIKAIQGVTMDASLPSTGSFLELNCENKVMVSGIKQAENGDGIIVRLWNNSDDDLSVHAKTRLNIRGIEELRLDETVKIRDVGLEDGHFKVDIAAHKIVTLRMFQ